MTNQNKKSFWSRPEGKTSALIVGGLAIGSAYMVYTFIGAILGFLATTLGQIVSLLVLGTIVFLAIDSKSRKLIGYMYRSLMRWITGLFVQIDPLAILNSYVEDLKANLKKMDRQINQLRGQMHKLKEMIFVNQKEINKNLSHASDAKKTENKAQFILKSRKAGRLKQSNIKLEDLYRKMEILYRVLNKMFENSSILMEDIADQVTVKEKEKKAILAGHSAMKSAMDIINGNSDKKAIFDRALEAVADDVSQKVGEMEQFMEMSESFMKSIDLQNGVFEEEGIRMLEKWENDSDSLLLGSMKEELILEAHNDENVLELEHPIKEIEQANRNKNQYDSFFD